MIWKNPIRILAKASSAQTNLANTQAQFYQTMINAYAVQFAGQSAILNSLQAAWDPILKAGPEQPGYSPQLTTSLNTAASDVIANNSASAETALNNDIAARGGGNAYVPSGAEEQLKAGFLSNEATQQSQATNAITQESYAQGNKNFMAASGALTNTAGLYAPLGYAGATTGAGNAAFGEATTINQENTAWQSALAGALGGIAGGLVGGPAGAAGGLQGSIAGFGNSNQYDPTMSLADPGFAAATSGTGGTSGSGGSGGYLSE